MKSKKEREEDLEVRALSRAFVRRGLNVRREKLVRGSAFRAKSGDCTLQGENLIFVDRRLPPKQQLSVLVDYLIERGISLADEELDGLESSTRTLIKSREREEQALS